MQTEVVPCYYAVWLSDNPGVFVADDGPPKGVIVTEATDRLAEAPETSLFLMACTQFRLGSPRVSNVLPYLESFNPTGWRSVSIANRTFWTDCEADSFPQT